MGWNALEWLEQATDEDLRTIFSATVHEMNRRWPGSVQNFTGMETQEQIQEKYAQSAVAVPKEWRGIQ